jgi:hypothetical protein
MKTTLERVLGYDSDLKHYIAMVENAKKRQHVRLYDLAIADLKKARREIKMLQYEACPIITPWGNL